MWGFHQQEARKQRSGRSLNEDAREESADKKRGIFFSWSRNRSFGKGPKKKDIGDVNLGEEPHTPIHESNRGCAGVRLAVHAKPPPVGEEGASVSSSSSLLGSSGFPDYWGSNGRRESQGSLSSGTSLEMATSCKTEVRFHRMGLHGNTDRAITISSPLIFFFL